jgi:peptidylprolyl isomerase
MRRRNKVSSVRMAGMVLAWILLALVAFTGCGRGGDQEDSQQQTAEEGNKAVVEVGDRVLVQYRGTLADGSVFDESPPDQPLEFIVGGGQMIPGFETAVIGMSLGEEKRVIITPENAYGQRDSTQVAVLDRAILPEAYKPEEGMGIRLQDNMGRPVPGTIVTVGSDSIMVDLNHPLAGMDLTFDIKVLAIWGPAGT